MNGSRPAHETRETFDLFPAHQPVPERGRGSFCFPGHVVLDNKECALARFRTVLGGIRDRGNLDLVLGRLQRLCAGHARARSGRFHRKAHEIRFKEAAGWSVFWIALALIFNGLLLWQWHNIQPNSQYSNSEAALSFLTGYLIEKSLSVDNLFVILLIFSYFAVPSVYQHRVLFWGILGALLFRAVFIFAGVALIEKFAWMVLVFGGFLILTGIKMALQKDKKLEPEKNPVLRLFKRFVPVTSEYHAASSSCASTGGSRPRRCSSPCCLLS
jgi:hypothetical protein